MRSVRNEMRRSGTQVRRATLLSCHSRNQLCPRFPPCLERPPIGAASACKLHIDRHWATSVVPALPMLPAL